jgi:hypothetical protein
MRRPPVLAALCALFACMSMTLQAGDPAPTVWIQSPADGFATNAQAIVVEVGFQAWVDPETGEVGNVRDIDLFMNGTLLETKTSLPDIKVGVMPFDVDLSGLGDQVLMFEAHAYQGHRNGGHRGESEPVGGILDRTPPQLTIISPSDIYVALNEPRVAATIWYSDVLSGVDFSGVHLTLDGSDVTNSLQHVAIGEARYEPADDLSEVQHSYAAWVVDTAGNASPTVIVTFDVVFADAAAWIGSAGGGVRVDDVTSPVYGLELTVPPGALDSPALIQVEYDPSAHVEFDSTIEHGTTLPGFNILPDGMDLVTPALLRFPYTDTDQDEILDGTDLPVDAGQFYFSSEPHDELVPVDTTVNGVAMRYEAEIDHFSKWRVHLQRWNPGVLLCYQVESLPVNDYFSDDEAFLSELRQSFDRWSDLNSCAPTFSGSCDASDIDVHVISTDLCNSNDESLRRFCDVVGVVTRNPRISSSLGAPYKLYLNTNVQGEEWRWFTGPYDSWPEVPGIVWIPFMRYALHEVGHVVGTRGHVQPSNQSGIEPHNIMAVEHGELLSFTAFGPGDLEAVRRLFRWDPGCALTIANWDFEGDPGFSSPQPSYVYWDSANGWYVANVRDVSTGVGHYYGLSPSFPVVSDESFVLEFDFNVVLQDWGSYPAVYLVDGSVPDPVAPSSLRFSFAWTDATYKVFELTDRLDHVYLSGVPAQGIWYHVRIEYDVASSTVDLRVTNRSTGALFWELNDEPLDVSFPFDTIALGQRTVPPRYGTLSTAYYDNVVISRP